MPFTIGGTAIAVTDFKGITFSPLVIPAARPGGRNHRDPADDGVYGGAIVKTLTFTLTQGSPSTNTLSIAEIGPLPSFPALTPQERYVQALYVDDLGRAGILAELDSWVAVLNGPGGDQAVASGIEHSPEARKYLVQSWYRLFLARSATSAEEAGWVNELLEGQSEEMVLSQFLSDPVSNEFFNRAQTLVTTGTADERYVQALYELLLHRAATSSELAGWISVLPQQGIQGVTLSILQLPEFRMGLFSEYYDDLLSRPSDAVGLAAWVNSGLDASSIRVGFLISPEFLSDE